MRKRLDWECFSFSFPKSKSAESLEAPRAKRVKWAKSLKCLKTNLESRGVLCGSYRLVVVHTVNCTEMAH